MGGVQKFHQHCQSFLLFAVSVVQRCGVFTSFTDLGFLRIWCQDWNHVIKYVRLTPSRRPLLQVAQRCGVYTSFDYADIVDHLIRLGGISDQKGLSAEGLAAQEYLCTLPDRVRRLAERTASKVKKGPARLGRFSWVFNKEVPLL